MIAYACFLLISRKLIQDEDKITAIKEQYNENWEGFQKKVMAKLTDMCYKQMTYEIIQKVY